MLQHLTVIGLRLADSRVGKVEPSASPSPSPPPINKTTQHNNSALPISSPLHQNPPIHNRTSRKTHTLRRKCNPQPLPLVAPFASPTARPIHSHSHSHNRLQTRLQTNGPGARAQRPRLTSNAFPLRWYLPLARRRSRFPSLCTTYRATQRATHRTTRATHSATHRATRRAATLRLRLSHRPNQLKPHLYLPLPLSLATTNRQSTPFPLGRWACPVRGITVGVGPFV